MNNFFRILSLGVALSLLSFTAFSAVLTQQVNPNETSIFDTSHLGDEPEEVPAIVFLDIEGHWAKQYIEILYDAGVVNGKSENTFEPDGNITRAELTKIALIGFDYSIDESVDSSSFTDVLPSDWFAPYVEYAKQEGIVKGYGYLFKPNAFITRAEALKILSEFAKVDTSISTGVLNFTDVKISDWFYKYVKTAVNLGVINGYADNTFRPNAFITRAEASKILVKMIELQ